MSDWAEADRAASFSFVTCWMAALITYEGDFMFVWRRIAHE